MRAGDGDGAAPVDDLAQGLGALHDGDVFASRGVDFDVRPPNGRGDDDEAGVFDVGGIVSDEDRDTVRGEEVRRRGGLQIASGDIGSGCGHDAGNATHSDSADPDEMNVFNILEIHSR